MLYRKKERQGPDENVIMRKYDFRIQEQKGEHYRLKENKKSVYGQRRARNAGRNKDVYKDGCYRGMLCWIGKPVQFWSALIILIRFLSLVQWHFSAKRSDV